MFCIRWVVSGASQNVMATFAVGSEDPGNSQISLGGGDNGDDSCDESSESKSSSSESGTTPSSFQFPMRLEMHRKSRVASATGSRRVNVGLGGHL